MSQITATFNKTIKGFLRNRAVLFWTIAWPIILLIILSFTVLNNVPADIMPLAKGGVTVSMVFFALTLAGMSNLASDIARDRESGLLAKLKSMPISPARDFLGRILALIIFALIAVALVTATGLAIGARFNISIESLQAVGFLLLAICASAGVGLIIGSLGKTAQGVVFTGVGISVVAAFLSGLFISYSSLPDVLKAFGRIYPVSSAGASTTYLLLGEAVAGYNPFTAGQLITMVALSLAFLGAGIFLYSRMSWKKD
ncbi:MAG: ABC transporter permease [Dehalococcoidia bacterium]|jgi:ABC-2 type transport system permease protein